MGNLGRTIRVLGDDWMGCIQGLDQFLNGSRQALNLAVIQQLQGHLTEIIGGLVRLQLPPAESHFLGTLGHGLAFNNVLS